MFDPKELSEYALSHPECSHEDVEHSLKLFQTFKRLYDQNPALLDEILSLAMMDGQLPVRTGNFGYILGLVTDKQALLLSNLTEGRSQIFVQPSQASQIWTIGRDPQQASLAVRDRRLSRCHAAIRYQTGYGFMLYDLNSTNGSYVNGVRIRASQSLQDGDHIRLGSLNFGFFMGSEFRRTVRPSPDILQWIDNASIPPTAPLDATPQQGTITQSNDIATFESEVPAAQLEKTLHFLRRSGSKDPSSST